MWEIVLSVGFVWAIIYVVPMLVYGVGSAIAGLKMPQGASPARFLASALVSKVGAAVGFVLIFYFAREELTGRFLLYAGLWWAMFVLGEVGQAIGSRCSWKEAIAGMISEAIYWPLAALAVRWLIGAR